MKNTYVCISLMTVLLMMTGCAALHNSSSLRSESYVRAGFDFIDNDLVAIVDVVGEVDGERAKNQIADLFTLQLLSKGFSPIQREHVRRLLNEAGFDQGELSPEAYAIEAGRVLHVPCVLIVTVPRLDMEASLTAKILEVENGSALWLGSGSIMLPRGEWFAPPQDPFAEQLGGSIFTPETMGTAPMEQPAPIVEAPMDIALTPGEIESFNAIIKAICKKIPHVLEKAEPQKKNQYGLSSFKFW